MFDATDPDTFPALSELCKLVRESKKPIVFWIGAGASAWAGLSLWKDLADLCYQEFSRHEKTFDKDRAGKLLFELNLPEFFSHCKKINEGRFNRFMHAKLCMPKSESAVYARFIAALKRLGSSMLVTTNVDELLERSLGVQTLVGSSLGLVPDLIFKKEAFVAKLHGTIGDVSSLVFTTDDYTRVLSSPLYLDLINQVLSIATVVFIGYSLTDEYVVQSLARVQDLKSVFGSGPHFVCASGQIAGLPASVRRIKYTPTPHKDHRTAIQVIEEMSLDSSPLYLAKEGLNRIVDLKSAHMLADCTPAGIWSSSQRVVATKEDKTGEIVFFHGHGLNQSEMPYNVSTAMHDLVVGLLCFDHVYVPLTFLGRVHDLVGASRFELLIRADVFRFVRFDATEAVVFQSGADEAIGSLASISFPPLGPDKTRVTNLDVIRREIRASPGREQEAELLFSLIESKTVEARDETPIPVLVRGLLLRPSVRNLIGMSGGTKSADVPEWLKFPILRLAGVVRLGSVCQRLNLCSVKFGVGNDQLAGPVFSTAAGRVYAESVASYIIAGNFKTDVGGYINATPSALDAVLRFRETRQGESLRLEILQRLSASDGGDVVASINAGLNEIVPPAVLEASRESFTNLCLEEGRGKYPAVWIDANYSTTALGLWKTRASERFVEYCKEHKISAYDKCPCGSGEKVKFCCSEALAAKF